MTTSITPYQKKILLKLAVGEILSRSHLGPFTGAYHFHRDYKHGVNGASIDKLRHEKFIEITDKVTMYGLVAYVHLPGVHPWTKDESWIAYARRH